MNKGKQRSKVGIEKHDLTLQKKLINMQAPDDLSPLDNEIKGQSKSQKIF